MERKLTAILSADVKGYSRLMGEDEEATIRTLTDYRAVMTALIQQHRGRVVDSPGDNLLAEFGSPAGVADQEHGVTSAAEDGIPYWYQRGRCDRRGRANLRRRSQYRRPPGR